MTSYGALSAAVIGNFNPHEREARDDDGSYEDGISWILIHTSVKLVTAARRHGLVYAPILIHTSVKLVTRTGGIKATTS